MSICKTSRWGALLAAALLAVGGLAWGVYRHRAPRDGGVGRALAQARLRDLAGRWVPLRDLRGERAMVLVFTGIDCPIANLYMPRLSVLAKRLSGKLTLEVFRRLIHIGIRMTQPQRDKALEQPGIQQFGSFQKAAVFPIVREIEYCDGERLNMFQHPSPRQGKDPRSPLHDQAGVLRLACQFEART